MTRTVAFVVSHNYSGSTWLSLMLGSHSAGFSLGEVNKCYSEKQKCSRLCAICDDASRQCPYFGDVQRVPRSEIHQVMFDRTGATLLVDNSKRIQWCSHFLGESSYRRKYIHLIRDPRGVYYSLALRGREPDLEHWAQRNREIQ